MTELLIYTRDLVTLLPLEFLEDEVHRVLLDFLPPEGYFPIDQFLVKTTSAFKFHFKPSCIDDHLAFDLGYTSSSIFSFFFFSQNIFMKYQPLNFYEV